PHGRERAAATRTRRSRRGTALLDRRARDRRRNRAARSPPESAHARRQGSEAPGTSRPFWTRIVVRDRFARRHCGRARDDKCGGIMGKAALGCVVVLVIAVIVVGMAVMGVYNNLVTLQQAVEQQWAQVENVYQRRADLVPNLVAT